MSNALSVSTAADRLSEMYGRKVRPKDISDLFYARRLDCERCPVFAGRRMIPVDYLDGIAIELRRMGKLPPLREVAHV